MNILYVAPTDPRETGYGGPQRTHAIWKGLKSIPGAKVTVVVPEPHRCREREEPEEGIFHLCFECRYRLGWILQRLLKRFMPYYCDWPMAYDWRALHRRFAGTDVVVARYVKSAWAYKLWKLAPLYVDADDIHTLEWDLASKTYGNSLRRRLQRMLLNRVQFGAYRHARQIWVPAREHVGLLPGYPFTYLPNIPVPPLPDVATALGDRNRLFFVGAMNSSPNFLALDDFLAAHWRKLRELFPGLEFDIAGGGLPEAYKDRWSRYPGVNLLGFVKDIRPLYQSALALLTPMKIGMGSCIKVLESLRMGRPVVSTAQGLRGIPEGDRTGENGMFAFADYEGLAAAIRTLREVPDSTRISLQQSARKYAEANYSQQTVNAILSQALMR